MAHVPSNLTQNLEEKYKNRNIKKLKLCFDIVYFEWHGHGHQNFTSIITVFFIHLKVFIMTTYKAFFNLTFASNYRKFLLFTLLRLKCVTLFFFFCMAWNFLLLETGHFGECIIAILGTSPYHHRACFCYLLLSLFSGTLDYFSKVWGVQLLVKTCV